MHTGVSLYLKPRALDVDCPLQRDLNLHALLQDQAFRLDSTNHQPHYLTIEVHKVVEIRFAIAERCTIHNCRITRFESKS